MCDSTASENNQKPTDLKALRRYREAHADCHESIRTWLLHSHTYFDHAAPARVTQAREFSNLIRQTYSESEHIDVTAFASAPVGPHPRGSFEVLFTREVFVDYLTWLMFMRPQGFEILTHPLTRSQTLDHSARALWLGTPLAIDLPMPEEVDARLVAPGRTEESIINGNKRH